MDRNQPALAQQLADFKAAFKQRALPTTLFFDARGRLVSMRVGELSAATLTERLQALAP